MQSLKNAINIKSFTNFTIRFSLSYLYTDCFLKFQMRMNVS